MSNRSEGIERRWDEYDWVCVTQGMIDLVAFALRVQKPHSVHDVEDACFKSLGTRSMRSPIDLYFMGNVWAGKSWALDAYNRLKKDYEKGMTHIGHAHPDYVRDDGFYNTRAWREVRMVALKAAGGRCACCGASAKDGARLHVDHIKPRYKRPDLSLVASNLQVLCEDCNFGKGAWDDTDWR